MNELGYEYYRVHILDYAYWLPVKTVEDGKHAIMNLPEAEEISIEYGENEYKEDERDKMKDASKLRSLFIDQ